MRMRNKPWARPELEACSWFVQEPQKCRGEWKNRFTRRQPLYLELGCGKGGFIAQAALQSPEINFVAVDIEFKMLGVARRKVAAAFVENGMTEDNILLTKMNIEQIGECFSAEDEVERIYINFCNPWPREKHKKHRLTHPRQLIQYKSFLKPGGEIFFKTDDDGLFEDSVEYFRECGFEIKYLTRDLHSSGFEPNIMTEHEKMFSDEGIPIKFLIAVSGVVA